MPNDRFTPLTDYTTRDNVVFKAGEASMYNAFLYASMIWRRKDLIPIFNHEFILMDKVSPNTERYSLTSKTAQGVLFVPDISEILTTGGMTINELKDYVLPVIHKYEENFPTIQ
jgi:hypothetical protein